MLSSKLLGVDTLNRMNLPQLLKICEEQSISIGDQEEQHRDENHLRNKIVQQQRIKKLHTFVSIEHKLELLVFGFIHPITTRMSSDIKQLICMFMSSVPSNTLIIYNGTGYMKTGTGFADNPLSIFPSIVGPNNHIGDLAMLQRGSRMLRSPIAHGIVSDFEDMDRIWHHILNENKSSSEWNVLLTEKPFVPKSNREKKTQLMFETGKVNGLYLECDAVLSLYASGRWNGCVMHSGAGVSYTVPVYEGHCLKYATNRLRIGGRDVTDYLTNMFRRRGYSFTTSAEKLVIERVKEQFCYAALYFEDEIKKYEAKYALPDDNEINGEYTYFGLSIFGNDLIEPVELMFNPKLIGMASSCGIHELCQDSIKKCPLDLRQGMYRNILLSGGNMMHQGMKQRVEKEMKIFAPTSTRINVIDVKDKNVLSWRGGSIFASTSIFHELMMTKVEYYEYGPSIVHRKCF